MNGGAILGRYRGIQMRVEERIPLLFDHLPRTGLKIMGEFAQEGSSTPPAWYTPPATGGERPGIFHVNLSLAEEHTRGRMETWFLREGLPGRHLQTALAREADSRRDKRRCGGQPGYVEAWAEYATCLGDLLGLSRFRTGDGGPILELREVARKSLGSRFDLREFHRRVLYRGPVPLDFLRDEMDRWIRGQESVKPVSHSSSRAVSFP